MKKRIENGEARDEKRDKRRKTAVLKEERQKTAVLKEERSEMCDKIF